MKYTNLVLGVLGAVCAVSCPLFAASPIVSEPYTWQNAKILGGGFVSGIITQPGLIYARTDVGGAYRWDSAKKEWIPITDSFGMSDSNLIGIESVALDPTDPKRVYLAGGTYTQSWAGNGAILRSQDQGKTWQRTDLPMKLGGNEEGRSNGERLMVDPNQHNILFFGSRKDGLWRSDDFAKTWTQVKSFPDTGAGNGVGIVFVVFDPTSASKGKASQTIYAGVSVQSNGLYRSSDGGVTWQAVSGQPTGLRPNHGILTPDGNLYLSYGDQPGPNGMGDGAIWKYNTKTQTWTDITPQKISEGDHFGYGGVTVDAQHPNTLMAVTMDRWSHGDEIYRTTDGGAHWTSLVSQLIRDGSNAKWTYWHRDKPGGTGWMGDIEIDPSDPNHALYVTGAGIWESHDVTHADSNQPTHWRFTNEGLEETVPIDLISPSEGAHLISGVGDIGGFRHDDLTVSPAGGMFDHPFFSNTDSLDFAAHKPLMIVRVGRADGRNRRGGYSTDGGTTWEPFGSEPSGSKGSGIVAISADGSTILWTPRDLTPSYSRDLGTTWAVCAGAPSNVRIVADRVNANKFYGLDTKTGTIYLSTDSGTSFSMASQGLPQGGSLRSSPGIEGDLWLSGESGLRHSTDSGVHFVKLTSAQRANAIGFGKSAPDKTYPALYLVGKVNDVEGIFRSDDMGISWIRINDDQHQYGWVGHITGDPRIYGRVYIGTGGRGVLYADPKK